MYKTVICALHDLHVRDYEAHNSGVKTMSLLKRRQECTAFTTTYINNWPMPDNINIDYDCSQSSTAQQLVNKSHRHSMSTSGQLWIQRSKIRWRKNA